MENSTDYDIATIGGGLNGMTAALAVAELGFRVVLIEPQSPEYELPAPFDPRSYAITQTSIEIFKKLGVWSRVDEQRNADILRMEVWDSASRGRLEFSPEPILVPRFGVITEHANLGRALQQTITGHPKIDILPKIVSSIVPGVGKRDLVFNDNTRLSASLVICADGAWSNTRAMLGIEAEPFSYQQKALVCNVATAEPHGHVARQVFHQQGPLAFLPLADPQQSAIVWSNSFETSAELMSLSDEELAERIERACDRCLGDVRVVSQRFNFPLHKMHTPRYDAERAVLVGDAAHVVHPLAGQGLNLGIMDAAVLAEVLAPLASEPKLPAVKLRSALRRYSRWRAHDNGLMLHTTDILNKLFAHSSIPLRMMRGLGLNLTNKLPPLIKMFTEHAVGQTGELPRLARGDAR